MGKSAFVIIILLSFLGMNAQIKLDSLYTIDELNAILDDARLNYKNKVNKTKLDDKRLADAYYLKAEFEERRFNHRKSFDLYTGALQYYKLAGDSVQINKINLAIAKRYTEAGLFQEAEELYNKSLEYYQSKDDQFMVSGIYYEMAKLFEERGDLETEQQFINKAIRVNRKVGDTLLMLKFMMEKVANYQRLNELDSALLVAFNAFNISDEFTDRDMVSKSLFAIGNINKLNLDYEKAIKYISKALEYTNSKPYDEDRRRLYKALSEIYSRVNNYEMAFEYENRYAELNDSILRKERNEALENKAIQHDVEQTKREMFFITKEKEYAEERNKTQKSALYIMAAGLTLLLILIYYLIRFYTQKIRTEKIITSQVEKINSQKIRELEDNMKINSMQSMIEGQEIERERIAQDLHDSLGGLLSTIKLQFDNVGSNNNGIGSHRSFQKANSLLDTAVTEVRAISHNLQPSALMNLGLVPAINDLINRFDGEHYPEIDFQHYDMPEKIDNMVALSIYRVVQELFHNAMKHSQAKEILLQINREGDEIIIQFEDDGVGFDKDKIEKKGMGLENIESRINYLKGSMEIDSTIGNGTSYLIHLKYT